MKKEIREYLKKIGRKGGQSKSEAKVAASRRNGLKGGRKIKREVSHGYAKVRHDGSLGKNDRSLA